MAKAVDLINALATATGRTASSVESYGLALRRGGWWRETKRGAGALPVNEMDAAKLLLALLSSGPADLAGRRDIDDPAKNGYPGGFFIQHANLCALSRKNNAALLRLVREVLELSDDAKFLDFIAALVRLYRDGEAGRLVYWSPDPPGFRDEWAYEGPDVEVRIKGPFPVGVISFSLALPLIDRLEKSEGNPKPFMGQQRIIFLDQMFAFQEQMESAGGNAEDYGALIEWLRETTSKGIGYERFFGGREIGAAAAALSANPAGAVR